MSIVKIITNQVKYICKDKKDHTDIICKLYSEITNFLTINYPDYWIVDKIINPDKIEKTDNFQYLIKNNEIQILNKYF